MAATVSIIPRPDFLVESAGIFVIGPSTTLGAAEGAEGSARILRARLRTATGYELAAAPAMESTISLEIDSALPVSGYEIAVTSDRVLLKGGDAAGLFHATQTFLQLCPPAVLRRSQTPTVEWVVPSVEIRDQPRFAWRGMLLDVSRHFFGRDSVFTLIDALALHRLNVLHLHLTDDQGWRVQIERYPLLTEIGSWRANSVVDNDDTRPQGQEPVRDSAPHDGYFTQEDLREIVAYAAERHITVMPEIDIPGHSQAAIAAYPELGNGEERLEVWTNWGINEHILNVEESTIDFFKNVLDEVLEIFPSEYIHIGGDEVPKKEWRESATAQARIRELGLRDEDELQSWVIGEFGRYLAERGRRLVGWDEILEGGLADGATVMSWRGTEGGIAAAEAGHDVVMAPDNDTYFHHRQTEDRSAEPPGADPVLTLQHAFEYDPMPSELEGKAREHVLGAQCQMWTERVSSERQMHQMAFPRMCGFSEAVWRSGDPVPFVDFEERMRTHRLRLHAMGIDAFEGRPGV